MSNSRQHNQPQLHKPLLLEKTYKLDKIAIYESAVYYIFKPN